MAVLLVSNGLIRTRHAANGSGRGGRTATYEVLRTTGQPHAYDNALDECFVDTFKTELVADRVWRTRTQLELAIVEWVAWFNNDRLHE